MSNHIEGRVVVVTGAGGGFGRLIAEMCADRGGLVVAADIDADAATATAEAITARGDAALARRTDVTDKAQVEALVAAAIDRFGAVDVIVNNAGTMPLAFFADHERAYEAWDRCIDINVKGVLHGMIAAYDPMVAQGRGHVVNISSIYGNRGTAGSGVYSATKAAVIVLSDSLRQEAKGKIKVTVVRPTGVPATGLGRTMVNGDAARGVLGEHADTYFAELGEAFAGRAAGEKTDPDSVQYLAIAPEELAAAVVHCIDQPWGVNISDITVRATGDAYIN
jgi:NADP-dependent 3-hydroxy acid dehydrogenase YdfG